MEQTDTLLGIDPESGELMHYGVKGMKWGVRKVPERVGKKVTRKGSELKQRRAIQKKRIVANNNRSSMSDAELNRRISRLEKERRLNELTKSEVTRGRSKAKRVLGGIATTTITAVGIGAGKYVAKKAIEKRWGEKVASEIVKTSKKK